MPSRQYEDDDGVMRQDAAQVGEHGVNLYAILGRRSLPVCLAAIRQIGDHEVDACALDGLSQGGYVEDVSAPGTGQDPRGRQDRRNLPCSMRLTGPLGRGPEGRASPRQGPAACPPL